MVFKCEYCEYTAKYKSIMSTHTRTHTGERPFKCTHPGCSYAASQKVGLKRHIRTHNKNSVSMQSSTLMNMCVVVPKKFTCDYGGCSYSCNQKTNLIAHQQQHTTIPCQYDDSFTMNSASDDDIESVNSDDSGQALGDLILEERDQDSPDVASASNSNEKFCCGVPGCNFSTSISNDMRIHRYKHQPIHPYVCGAKDCLFGTSSMTRMCIHSRIHP